MAYKEVELADIGLVRMYKRRGGRSIRLSVNADGRVRVTLPASVSYEAAIRFTRSKADWLQTQLGQRQIVLENAQPIGKQTTLRFTASFSAAKPTARVKGNDVQVTYPSSLSQSSPAVQAVATRAAIRALKRESEELLPARLRALALEHGFEYKSVQTKRLKTRWGSCDQDGNITLNIFLMQLPWPLIDYVLIHELVHTRELHHGPGFWNLFESAEPAAKALRKQIKQYQPNFVLPQAS